MARPAPELTSAECCPDCGRPFSADACGHCYRSTKAPWPVNHVGLDIGKGNPGAARGSPAGRKYTITLRMNQAEALRVKQLADELGHAVGRTVRDLIDEAFSHRDGRPAPRPPRPERVELSDERRAELRELARPGNEPQRPPAKLRPVHEFGPFER